MISNGFVVLFMLSGLFFFLVGTIGLIRLPDAVTRAHGAAKCDTLGAALCLLGLIIYSGFHASSLKLLLVICFLWITTPTATHSIVSGIVKSHSSEKRRNNP